MRNGYRYLRPRIRSPFSAAEVSFVFRMLQVCLYENPERDEATYEPRSKTLVT